MRIIHGAMSAAFLAVSSAGVAAEGIYAEVGFATVHDVEGVEAGIGYQFGADAFAIRPIIGALFTQGDTGGYEWDSSVDRCRAPNGQFATDESCTAVDMAAYGKLEGAYLFDNGLELGLGIRFDEENSDPYALAAYRMQGVGFQAQIGEEYQSIGISFGRNF